MRTGILVFQAHTTQFVKGLDGCQWSLGLLALAQHIQNFRYPSIVVSVLYM